MNHIKHLEIPIREKILGTPITQGIAEVIVKNVTSDNLILKECLASVIENHNYGDDKQKLRDDFEGMQFYVEQSIKKNKIKLSLICHNVPDTALFDREHLTPAQFQQFSSIIRDLALPLYLPDNEEPRRLNADDSPETVSKWIKDFVHRTGLLDRGKRSVVSFVWGGHSLPTDYIGEFNEYRFAEKIGYFYTLINTRHHKDKNLAQPAEDITGSGPGIMKAPFKGSLQAFHELQQKINRFFIGFTEQGIMSAEKSNKLVDRLVVFPDIEKRMEAFIRAAHRGRVHPGGIGTLEEIMMFLSMKLHPRNHGLIYPFDWVERPGGQYFDMIDQYLKTCFKDSFLEHYQIFNNISPRTYALHIKESNLKLDRRFLWNDHLYFPRELQTPFQVTFESVEALELYDDVGPYKLCENLRKFFSALVTLNIKRPEILESWGTDRPRLHGSSNVLKTTDHLIDKLTAAGRMKIEGEYMKPYRIH
ncbi:MAG: DUF3412 domain-containing protein [SAR324 cluster bacterium]|nr:DUF3412 domain-containing protein [SAR324 cluster bacterium]